MNNPKSKLCPACGAKLSYKMRIILRDKEQYLCPKCEKTFKVETSFGLYILAIFTLLFAAVMTAIGLLFSHSWIFLCTVLTILDFLVFYSISPLFVYLKNIKEDNKSNYKTKIISRR